MELEEAYALTTSLPWNLQVKGGQFFAEFGRQNPTHPHAWAFVDEPLVMGRLLGGDGLRNVGTRVSWLAPTPFYTEVLLGVFNGEGGTAFSFRDTGNTYGRTPVDRGVSALDDLLYVPRVTSSFDLTDTQTLVVGASGAFGAERHRHQHRHADLRCRSLLEVAAGARAARIPVRRLGRPKACSGVTRPAPTPPRRLPSETFDDWRFLLAGAVGLSPRLDRRPARRVRDAATRARSTKRTPTARADRTRVSPNLTWYPDGVLEASSAVQLRPRRRSSATNTRSGCRLEFLLGAHGAHKF